MEMVHDVIDAYVYKNGFEPKYIFTNPILYRKIIREFNILVSYNQFIGFGTKEISYCGVIITQHNDIEGMYAFSSDKGRNVWRY